MTSTKLAVVKSIAFSCFKIHDMFELSYLSLTETILHIKATSCYRPSNMTVLWASGMGDVLKEIFKEHFEG